MGSLTPDQYREFVPVVAAHCCSRPSMTDNAGNVPVVINQSHDRAISDRVGLPLEQNHRVINAKPVGDSPNTTFPEEVKLLDKLCVFSANVSTLQPRELAQSSTKQGCGSTGRMLVLDAMCGSPGRSHP